MSKTIVQDYGPIYGEAVNGTVMGRPNGSVYVPMSNIIEISLDEDYRYVTLPGNGWYQICDSAGVTTLDKLKVSAESQDLASYVYITLYDDALLTSEIGHYTESAGIFNFTTHGVYGEVTTTETTLYLRAVLMNNSTPVAISNTIEVGLI